MGELARSEGDLERARDLHEQSVALHRKLTRKTILSTALHNLACVLMIVGIWIEKGMGLIIPAFVPSPLGELVEYQPTWNWKRVHLAEERFLAHSCGVCAPLAPFMNFGRVMLICHPAYRFF